jgi:hypothetical protein
MCIGVSTGLISSMIEKAPPVDSARCPDREVHPGVVQTLAAAGVHLVCQGGTDRVSFRIHGQSSLQPDKITSDRRPR